MKIGRPRKFTSANHPSEILPLLAEAIRNCLPSVIQKATSIFDDRVQGAWKASLGDSCQIEAKLPH